VARRGLLLFRAARGLGPFRALLCVVACAAGASLIAPQAAHAVIDDEGSPTEGSCPFRVYNIKLEATPAIVGIPVAGGTVQVNAANAKLVGTRVTAARICEPLFFQVTKFRWSIASQPAGQNATISGAGTLTPSVNLGGPGPYRIRLTACPGNCRLTLGGKTRIIGPSTREITIDAVGVFSVPPEVEPTLPALSPPAVPYPSYSYSERNRLCQGGGGVQDPQWVTAGAFNGPADYRTLEGEVESSHVASQDNFLNHDSQDQNWNVQPDPPYYGLPHPSPTKAMEMEWETDHMPREFRPTAGDRASTVGFWIFDCGHEPFRAEIHPPVGIAVHRARAVQVPSTFRPAGYPNGLGSNVQVPGISTDIWFNRKAGEITNNCSSTALHRPPVKLRSFTISGPCVREPNPINRAFTFNIYLPRDPRLRARELGLNPPPVPLLAGPAEKLGQGTGGPEPTIAVRSRDGVTWLEVTVDLSNFTGTTYARRISAAWAYPNVENWGARRWNIFLRNMKVGDDAEPPGDDGDWRFFFNTTNRDREWTKVFSCSGCIDDDETKRLNVRTGSSGLGPDPVLFPGQPVVVHTGGFDDEVWGDDIGTVHQHHQQRSADYSTASRGGDGSYRLRYSIRPGPAVGRAGLTAEGAALAEAYTVRARPPCPPAQAQSFLRPGEARPLCGPLAALSRDPTLMQTWHPDNFVLNQRVRRGSDFELFESELEEYVITGISARRLRRVFRSLKAGERRALLAEIRQELKRIPRRLRRDYYELVGTLERSIPRNQVGRALPPGFRRSLRPFPLARRH
jgi:hypothetical protein